MSATCARRRITSAACTSAWQRKPHAAQAKRLLRRFLFDVKAHLLHSRDEKRAFTSTTVLPASSALLTIMRLE
jgi:hypothetical protein